MSKKKKTNHDQSKFGWLDKVAQNKGVVTKTQSQFCVHNVNAKFCEACKELAKSKLSEDQFAAYESILNEDGPFFLTGPAGSGKSFVIDFLRNSIKGCCVTATTGSAALLVKGRTLHSFAGIHPTWGVINSEKIDARIKNCSVLVIDEVSMADVGLLEQVYMRFDRAGHQPKMILVGDFLQLPPVDGDSLFDSPRWPTFKVLKLTQQHRQSDSGFITILNQIRVGNLTEEVRQFLRSRTVDDLPDDCTHLMAHRESVDERNMSKLRELPGQRWCSPWEVEVIYTKKGKPKEVKQKDLEKSRFPEKLYLKLNARVVLLTNEPDGRWVNGSTGSVVSVVPGQVKVKLDTGATVTVGKDEDEILDADGNPCCIISQYPIRLAWALTIHKAQGMSMDRVGVDLDYHFAAGQTYVALSRCRTAEGLFLRGSIANLIVDAKALHHCQ
jgi:ATP-dependent exoDNAse (exonuclease V) alpha subunit